MDHGPGIGLRCGIMLAIADGPVLARGHASV